MAAVRRDRIGVEVVWGEWQEEKVSEMDIRSISSLIFKRKERPEIKKTWIQSCSAIS